MVPERMAGPIWEVLSHHWDLLLKKQWKKVPNPKNVFAKAGKFC